MRSAGLLNRVRRSSPASQSRPPRWGPPGYNGGKTIKGRKRHLLVDTQGTLLKNKVQPADIHARAGAELLLEGLQHLFPAIELMWADTAYRGLKDEIVHPAALVERRNLDAG
ncbi:transposase [Microvirga soli]|uniref:transposase n=1 Tax=Microvirga soli TaxID=1854496 RepID=UPI0028A7585A|nr:transposase [Microvirga soli]